MDLILTSTLWIGGIGLVCGATLAVAAHYFGVAEDPRVEKVTELLPGINCGGCGYAGCSEYARAVVTKGVAPNLCAPGGAATAQNLASFLGVATEAVAKRVALVLCGGNNRAARRRFAYNGISDCTAAAAVAGGDRACTFGCLGYGTCARICPVNAISVEDGLARIHKDLCISCGKCVAACPRRIIKLVPHDSSIHVLCSSRDKGAVVRQVCGVGCIACRICTKLSEDVIAMDGFLAVVDYTRPLTNEDLIAKCPGKCIRKA